MGASASKMEEDKALQLCRDRKKFVRQALDGRCSLAAAHVAYIQSLKSTGTALRKFVEPEVPVESSLYTSTNATPEPLALTDKSLSQLSFSSPSTSQQVDAAETSSPSPSPPSSNHYQANHMKFRGFSSKKVEERPPELVIATVTTGKPDSLEFEASPLPPGTPPWDYFGLSHPIDVRQLKDEEGVPELEDDEKSSVHERSESQDSVDEFDEPATDSLVRSFDNLNRVNQHNMERKASETEFLNGGKSISPDLSPLRAPSAFNAKETPLKDDYVENKVPPKDFLSSMKEIEVLFVKASESGKEVPRMLEANKLHFRPIFPGKESRSMASMFIKACFSCGDDPSQVKEEPPQTSIKYLTWPRTMSSRSFSGIPMGLNVKDDVEDLTNNLFNNISMISGSHASTLDRLYAWERKLYDEVKASEVVRREYDLKCRDLRHLESRGESSHRIDKTRSVVKDLHSRIRVAIQRIDSISKRIEELRDIELQPQLEELIEGLSRMWEGMFECHQRQYEIITAAFSNSNMKILTQSESRRQITSQLESELYCLSSSFTKWIGSQKTYMQAINSWLFKCVSIPQKSSKRKRRNPPPPLRNYGPPIYVTVGVWLDMLETLPTKAVSDSIKGLAGEVSHFLPRQEKNHRGKRITMPWKGDGNSDSGANLLGDDMSEDLNSGFERFQKCLVKFLGQLQSFAEDSVKMYVELEECIQNAKTKYNEKAAPVSQPT